MMKFLVFVMAALSCLRCTSASQEEQAILYGSLKTEAVKQVAVIGAGAGGASTAYHLSKFAASAGIPINITVFERNNYIGGRSTTVNAYNDPSLPVELGASIFVEVNRILVDAVKDFNLSTAAFIPQSDIPGAGLAVWNGQGFVITQSGSNGWWDIAKLLWKYGLAPVRTMRLVNSVVGTFLTMYDEPVFPFASLTQVVQDVGLLAVTAATGEQYLEENGITGPFGLDVIQASTRVNYAQNLEYIHGLEAMVCMAAENARSVQGGNWQIFDRMVSAANATVLLETEVTSVEQQKGRQRVASRSLTRQGLQESSSRDFDEVVLAAPNQFANISWDVAIDQIPYVQLHVTLFASPHLLSPSFFNLAPDAPAPRVILTTLPKGEPARKGPEGVGSPSFFSISLLNAVTNPHTGDEEYLYKIFSPSPPNATFLTSLLGLKQSNVDAGSGISEDDVTWIYRKVWNSYPYEYPRVTFEDVKLGDSLWYTGGMDSFISTMETNALMGKNVARLIVNEWQQKARGGDSFANMRQPTLLPETSVL